jgi:hypothetical protein
MINIRDSRGNKVCRINIIAGPDDPREVANLFAAAPDMYEACKLALSALQVEYSDGKGIVDAQKALHAFGNLRAAIAKAGE